MLPEMRLTLMLSVLVVLGTSLVSAAAPCGVELLRPDSLVGWDHGDPLPSGWRMIEGRLTGTGQSTPLLSAWTFGDFEIYFRWAVTQGGRLRMLFPDVPSGKGLQLVLSEQDQCGRLTDGDTELAPGRKLTTRCGKAHTASVRREGGKFSVTIDGRWICEVDVEAARRFGLGLAADGAAAGLSELRLREPLGERMFNGTDFTGWWTKGNLDHWRVERNQIVRFDRAGDYLRSEKLYANFTWSFEYKMERRGNSGLSLRTPKEGWPTADGMELQLLDTPYNAEIEDQPAMAVYGHVLPLERADMSERWNRVVVKADGWMISAWMNGELVQQVNTFHHPELKHRRLKGWLGFQDHGAWIWVRNVHILEAPPGLGMAAWRKPRPPLGVTAILDRLINPERLSVADGINSAVASKTISAEEPGEHVLADLAGPGAVVRIARGGDEGQLAFYFDGEKDPRIECKPGELQASLPPVGKDTNPLLTCLAYKKRLRIVLRDAATAQYRFDYLKLPGNLPVESFTDRESGFPRGWLPAVTTILRWLGSGKFHEHDRLPRFSSDPATIEPGCRAEVVHVDGAGIVKSLKLIAAGTVLDNNDLWLEVTIDGEKEPAVSAPARYLFPSLYGNYDNYVQADQGGLTTFLAMPFGEGITVALANRGGRPIPDVGVSLSVQQATEATKNEIAGRMRLRGVLQPAQEGTSELIRQEGSGRWVGLVYQVPEREPAGIDTLLVDGRP
ncbi:MAG: family 16 glycoside hydrolase, partial [Planctomycetota bacterium]